MPVLKRACWQGIFLWQIEKRKSIPAMTSPGSRSLVRPLDEMLTHGLVSTGGRHPHSLSISNTYCMFIMCQAPWKVLDNRHAGRRASETP